MRKSRDTLRDSQAGTLRKTQHQTEKEDFGGQETGFEEAAEN
jgi:hypothetical protein